MKHFRAVVVGTGFIGLVHVEALRRIGVDVAGVVGSTPEKSGAAAGALGIAGDMRSCRLYFNRRRDSFLSVSGSMLRLVSVLSQ